MEPDKRYEPTCSTRIGTLRHGGGDDGRCGSGAGWSGSRQSVMVADRGGGAVHLDDGFVYRDSGPDGG